MPVTFLCERCGKEKTVSPSTYAKGERHFCSRQCHMKTMNEELNPGRMTGDVKAKLSLQKIGTGEKTGYLKLHGRHSHRSIAEQILGRPLKPGEIVHHLDGNKRNNLPANLIVFPSQAEHAAWHAANRKEVMPI